MSSKKPAYFKKEFSFEVKEPPNDSQILFIRNEIESSPATYAAINERFHPEHKFEEVFEKLKTETSFADGIFTLKLNVRHKNSSIKFLEDKLEELVLGQLIGATPSKKKKTVATASELKTSVTELLQPPFQIMTDISNEIALAPIRIKDQIETYDIPDLNGPDPEPEPEPEESDQSKYDEDYKYYKMIKAKPKEPAPVLQENGIQHVDRKSNLVESFTDFFTKDRVLSFLLGFVVGAKTK